MASRFHRCPQCNTIGKVNRSRARNLTEKIRLVLFPVYGVYRCHNCNWRGWLVRSGATPFRRFLMVAFYALCVAAVLAGFLYLVMKYWPSANYKY